MLKYTVNKNRVILKFIALIVEIYLKKKIDYGMVYKKQKNNCICITMLFFI